MTHLNTAHKLGALSAVNDFTAWLQNDDGNPTEYPKRRGSILKTAQGNPMQPNPGVSAPAPMPMPAGGGTGGATGLPSSGTGGAAPVTPRPSVKSGELLGGNTRQFQDLKREGGILPVEAPKPTPTKPVAPPPQPVKLSADQAVEQVMRKLGKSMSRRPLGRSGTKYEALKQKLRKQKTKKAR